MTRVSEIVFLFLSTYDIIRSQTFSFYTKGKFSEGFFVFLLDLLHRATRGKCDENIWLIKNLFYARDSYFHADLLSPPLSLNQDAILRLSRTAKHYIFVTRKGVSRQHEFFNSIDRRPITLIES